MMCLANVFRRFTNFEVSFMLGNMFKRETVSQCLNGTCLFTDVKLNRMSLYHL